MSDGNRLKVAVAQVESIVSDVDANIDIHLDMIAQAREEEVDYLVFPEMSLTGHSAGPDAMRVALHRHDPRIGRLAEASGPMCTIFGLIEEGPAAQFYNTAIAVRNGETAFLHRKVNLATYGRLEEGKHFAGGRYIDTFENGGPWRSSVLICADLWNPALVYLAGLHGTTLLFAPISSGVEAVGAEFDNPSGWIQAVRFYAMVYGMPIVMCNRVGNEDGLTFWGGSCIVDPWGKVVANAGDKPELVAAEVDFEAVRKARFLLPTVRDSNLALVQREVARLVDIIGVPESVRKL